MNNDEMDMNFPLPLFEPPHVFFWPNEGNVNRRKRGREELPYAAVAAPPQQDQQLYFSMQFSPMLEPFPLQSETPSPIVSTGLHLALANQENNQIKRGQPDSVIPAYFSEELAAQINTDKNEIDQYLIAQGEQLRRQVAERHRRNYRTLLESVGNKLQEKDAEIERASRCISELEDRLTRLQTELMEWKRRAMTEQVAAASLHAQLQRATAEAAAAEARAAADANENFGESPAEDAESANFDPNGIEIFDNSCRACFAQPATVVLLPCCHLCICASCDFVSTIGDACPGCGCLRTGSLHVAFA
ncbi:hypothetical protein KFK09_018894 [Dendrobium nobile]|uniref:RING-type domain-containing protein n=1 Tax=Dendrobium nobile TaxID=94219 RepID=A0A8T3AXF8_DENNO|nr:hypothetical protein KFK09_018894 [Dendrobium nobile]